MVKKRGRPPRNKEKQDSNRKKNEHQEHIVMSEKESFSEANITIGNIQSQWGGLVSKYAGQVTDTVFNRAVENAMLHNPFIQNQRVKNFNPLPGATNKSDIQQALKNVTGSERQLRNISMELYYTNFVYSNLIRLEREVPAYYWYVTPQYVTKEDMQRNDFKEEIQFVNRIMESFEPALSFKTINHQVQIEGKSSYLVRKSYDENKKKVNYFLLEKMLPNEIKITGIGSNQQYVVSFNMMVFLNPMYDVSQYPPYIGEIWEEMKSNGLITQNSHSKRWEYVPGKMLSPDHTLEVVGNNYFYWVELSQDDCFTFGQELATPMCFPTTTGLFMDLKELDDYRWLMGSLMSKGVTSILTGEVPTVTGAKAGTDATIITPDLVLFYENLFSSTVSASVMPYFAPFKDLELHNIDNQPENMNIVYNRLRDLVATSGNGSLLAVNDKPSVAMVKANQLIAASRSNYLTLQFQQFLNKVINNQFNLKYEYKITLWGDIFDTNGELKLAKEMLQNGITSMLPRVLSAFNQTVEDLRAINDYIDVIGVKVYNRDSIEETQSVGRPRKEETEIDNDNTAASVDKGDNVSDIK